MASNGIKKHHGLATALPRTLNVQKFAESRASELESLHSIVSNRLNDDFRSRRNKRRRTTGFDNRVGKKRYGKRQKLGGADTCKEGQCSSLGRDVKEKLPRFLRRKIEFKESGFSICADGTKRLATHLWHAKRFSMKKVWGFRLPLGLHGRYVCNFFLYIHFSLKTRFYLFVHCVLCWLM